VPCARCSRSASRWVASSAGTVHSATRSRSRTCTDSRTKIARALVPPGTPRGIFRTLYLFADEAAAETRNATVHAFLVTALQRRGDGYRLYWAIYVKPVGRLTAVYMALIGPFRRLVVYPAMIREAKAGWARAYGRS
jgi:hypothetical protein